MTARHHTARRRHSFAGRDHEIHQRQRPPEPPAEPRAEGLREAAAFRTAMYGLISERVVSGAPGDWMRFEDAMNAAYDAALASEPETHP